MIVIWPEMEDHAAEREIFPKEVILIDSLLSIDQFKGPERVVPTKKHGRDIAEVAAAAEALLPKGSARITTTVSISVLLLLTQVLAAPADFQLIFHAEKSCKL